MTVNELIEELRKYPGDMPLVAFDRRDGFFCDVEGLELHQELDNPSWDELKGKPAIEIIS